MPHQQTPADPSREAQRPPGQVPGTAVSTFINRAVGALAPAAGPYRRCLLRVPRTLLRRCALRLPAERKNGGATPR